MDTNQSNFKASSKNKHRRGNSTIDSILQSDRSMYKKSSVSGKGASSMLASKQMNYQSTTVSPRYLNKVDKVIRQEEQRKKKLLPDIVKISLTDMNSLDKMSAANKKAYIERFSNNILSGYK